MIGGRIAKRACGPKLRQLREFVMRKLATRKLAMLELRKNCNASTACSEESARIVSDAVAPRTKYKTISTLVRRPRTIKFTQDISKAIPFNSPYDLINTSLR